MSALEEFEAAYKKTVVDRGFGHHVAEMHLGKKDSGEYVSAFMRGAWWAWQASRAEVVIDLGEMEWIHFDEAKDAIESHGLKVKP